MFDLSDPRTYWLNITNIGLGLVVLVCLIALVRGVLFDILERFSGKAGVPVSEDDHAFFEPELGLTMADGGEKRDGTK